MSGRYTLRCPRSNVKRLWETRTFGLESESTREMNKFWALEPFLAEKDKTNITTLWYGWGEQEIPDCSDELHTGGAWSVRVKDVFDLISQITLHQINQLFLWLISVFIQVIQHPTSSICQSNQTCDIRISEHKSHELCHNESSKTAFHIFQPRVIHAYFWHNRQNEDIIRTFLHNNQLLSPLFWGLALLPEG